MINITTMTEEQFDEWRDSSAHEFGALISSYDFKELSERTETDFLEWFFDRADSGNERYMELRYDLAMRNDDWARESVCIAYDYLDHLIEMTSAY